MPVKTPSRRYNTTHDRRVFDEAIRIFDLSGDKRAEALNSLELKDINPKSARACIQAVLCLLDGRPINFQLAREAMCNFVKWISVEREPDLGNALKSLDGHIEWRKRQIKPLEDLRRSASSGLALS